MDWRELEGSRGDRREVEGKTKKTLMFQWRVYFGLLISRNEQVSWETHSICTELLAQGTPDQGRA